MDILSNRFGRSAKPRKSYVPVLNPKSICGETKLALCFLCLFEGLRPPSIRRLSRKPRSICDKPLISFYPKVFSPGSSNAIHQLYHNTLNCPSIMSVDPSVETVLSYIQNRSLVNGGRLIIHYFGQGCLAPSDERIYFFNESRQRYKPLRVTKILTEFEGPLCVIMDCTSAATVLKYFPNNRDIFCFFACSQNEQLPISTDAPLDIFSRCLLAPYETAIWWHKRRHSCVFETSENYVIENDTFMRNFFSALLEALLFGSQNQDIFELYAKDPAMMQLAKGYLLSQRVFQSFNIRPVSLPPLKSACSHELWAFWDVAVDFSLSLSPDDAYNTVTDLFLNSFKNFPSLSTLPLFSFFISVPGYQNRATIELIKYLDSHSEFVAEASRSNVVKTILFSKGPSDTALFLLAKLLSAPGPPLITSDWAYWFNKDDITFDSRTLRASFLAIMCAAKRKYMTLFNSIADFCFERAEACAPYSALLLGCIIENSERLRILYETKGSAFMNHLKVYFDSADKNVAGAYVLGILGYRNAVPELQNMLMHKNRYARIQSAVSLIQICGENDQTILTEISKLKADSDEKVSEAINNLLSNLSDPSSVFSASNFVVNSVLNNNFKTKYDRNTVFN